MITTVALVAAVISFGAAYVTLWLIQYINHYLKSRRLGCRPPRFSFTRDPTGINILRQTLKAAHEKRIPNWVEDHFNRLSEEHGSLVGTAQIVRPWFKFGIITMDPKNIQAVLATNFRDYAIGRDRILNFRPLFGHGIFASNGKLWEHSRALLRPQFARSQISDISLEERHTQSLMVALDHHLDVQSGWTDFVDLQPLFHRLTLDSATEFLFGESVNSQIEERSDANTSASTTTITNAEFAESFDKALLKTFMASRYGMSYWIAHTKEFHAHVKKVHTYIDYYVEKALKGTMGNQKMSGEAEGRYVFLEALARETADPQELRSQLLNILFAGRDTTAATLSWFIHTMATPRYTSTYQKLRTILLKEFGPYRNPKDISFESMKKCQYLKWCMNEILRLYPVVPLNVRTAVQDTILPTGGGADGESPIYIRAGQSVGYSVYAMHRRNDLWGPDAEIFRPDRWEKRRPGWDYLPFNGGPRICIGQQFALTEIAYVLVRFVQRVDEIDGSQMGGVSHGLALTNSPGNGVNVRLHFQA